MNELQIFNYQDTQLRTVEKNGELWWVLKDVCELFGVRNHHNVATRLDADEKDGIHMADPMGRMQETTIVNEPGLYSALFSMSPNQVRGIPDELVEKRKQKLKDFKRWVTHEVLPSVRQTGSYSTQPPQLTPAQLIAAQAQVLVDMEQKMLAIQSQAQAIQAQQEQLSQRVDTAIKVFSRPSEDHWKADINQAIKDLCEERRLSDCATRGRMYRELEEKCGCNIDSRLTRLRQRVKKQGMRYRDAMALTKLDAIAADKQLRAAFEGIVREWQARSAVVDGQQVIRTVQENFLTEA